MGCASSSCSGCLSWSHRLPTSKLWECLDDMDIVDRNPSSRVSPRYRDHAFHFTRSSVTCISALILILLSVTLYLDRTLDQPAGWQLCLIDDELGGSSTQSKPAATGSFGDFSSNPPSGNLQDSPFGSEARIVRAVAPRSRRDEATKGGALQGMGVTFRKGSRAMSELVVAHLHDTTTPTEFRLFLRTLHRSGVTARADVVLLFPAEGHPDHDGKTKLLSVLNAEEISFWSIVLAHQSTAPNHITAKNSKKSTRSIKNSGLLGQANHTGNSIFVRPNATTTESKLATPQFRRLNTVAAKRTSRNSKQLNDTGSGPSEIIYNALTMPKVPICPFNFPAFWNSREAGLQGKGQRLRDRVMWKTNEQYLHGSGSTSEEMTEAVKWGDWGSIAGFDMQDLERDDAIAGFIDNPPSQLRRWMCYKMLLGMVKRQYQNVLLTEVKGVLIFGDVMSITRDPSFGSSVYLFSEDRTWRESHDAQEKFSTVNEASRSRELRKLRDDDRKAAKSGPESSQNGSDGNSTQHLSFIQDVYGKEVWKKLEEEDKQRAVLGSGIIMGNMKSIQSLSNAMLTEIVRVAAILRKSREPFHDQPLLNYVVQKSRVLNRKVSEKLCIFSNEESSVHSLPGSKQKSLFVREEGILFHALQGLHHKLVPEEISEAVIESIDTDICSSQGGLRVYKDCPKTYET